MADGTNSGTRKTRPTQGDVGSFLASVADERRRADAEAAVALVQEVTGAEPAMWGPSMIGFGHRPYTTADGKEHDYFAVGLSPRKTALTFYGLLDPGVDEERLGRLGPHTLGKGCVYVKRLDALDRSVLAELVDRAWRHGAT